MNSPDREKTYKGRVIALPGKPRALAKLTNIGENTSTARIIRQWKKVKAGHRANEMIYDPTATDFAINIRDQSNFNLTGKFWLSPFKKLAGALTGQLGTVKDTLDENDIFI